MSTFSPKSPTPVLTPDIVFQAMVETNVNYASGSAQFIQAWARDPEKVSFLKGIKGLLYGGTPLNKIVGDYLHKAGVNIQTFYGLTEVGVVGSVLPERLESEWEYFTINPHCAAEFVPTGDGAYELVVVLKSTHEVTSKSNTTFQGQAAYATGDLLVPHPTRPEYWKLLGRSNDQIILLDGNKANPRHYEDAISHHPEVAGAVVFGQGRPHIGILIEPRKDYTNEGSPRGNSALIDRFWSTIQEVNLQNRAHPQLLREMIVIADKGKPFAYTLKGTPNKRVILQQYAAEIDVLYHMGNNVEG
ncbi:hypothetical protein BD779DRAFT_1671990 [Infundibulicybe gibba]|nr:hypothetical protein BD779DRAFT_1671990 [Infundibulicybe gibba]